MGRFAYGQSCPQRTNKRIAAGLRYAATGGWTYGRASLFWLCAEGQRMNPVYFSQSYSQARERFLTASRDSGAHLESHIHPSQVGPRGEKLSVDIAYFGLRKADRIMVFTSGTHGVEGFAGSAAQLALIREGVTRDLPPDTALLLVHSLTPYGFAHLRRVDENNVDLNRNFVDHRDRRNLENGYAELHELLVPSEWTGRVRDKADAGLAKLAFDRGARTMQAAITGGQWTHPDGIFYGGSRPAWSNTVWRRIIRAYLHSREAVAIVDLHTGLGAYGSGEIIFRARFAGDGYSRARDWYGEEVTCSDDQTSSSTQIYGNMHSAVEQEIGTASLTSVTLEFGTLSGLHVLNALRGDNWLHVYGHPNHPLAANIKVAMRDAFYCDNDEWKELVLDDALETLRRGLAGLQVDP
jgi:hypothetical protein